MPLEIKTLGTTTSWNEDSTDKSTPRVTQVLFTLDLPSIKGTLTSQCAMVYHAAPAGADKAAGDASFAGADTVVAEDFAGKKGSFVMRGQGSYTGATGEVKAELEILPETGTGDLKDLRGKATAKSTGNKEKHGEMEYVFLVEGI
jgi:hypothetical protein